MSINKRGFYESVGCCFCSFDPSSRAKNKLDIRFSELEGNTLWKNCKMYIHREINCGDSKSAKSVIPTHVETLNFDFHEF